MLEKHVEEFIYVNLKHEMQQAAFSYSLDNIKISKKDTGFPANFEKNRSKFSRDFISYFFGVAKEQLDIFSYFDERISGW